MLLRTTILNKCQVFGRLIGIILLIGLAYQSIWWLFGNVTTAKVGAFSYYDKNPPSDTGRIQATYQVHNISYHEIFIKQSFITKDSSFPLRYLSFAPKICRPDTFLGNWGYIIVIWVLSLLVLIPVFVRNDILKKNKF